MFAAARARRRIEALAAMKEQCIRVEQNVADMSRLVSSLAEAKESEIDEEYVERLDRLSDELSTLAAKTDADNRRLDELTARHRELPRLTAMDAAHMYSIRREQRELASGQAEE